MRPPARPRPPVGPGRPKRRYEPAAGKPAQTSQRDSQRGDSAPATQVTPGEQGAPPAPPAPPAVALADAGHPATVASQQYPAVSAGEPAAQRAVTAARPSVVTTGLQARLAERDAMNRRRWYVRIAWILGAVAACGGLGWLVFFSPVMALEASKVTVTGTMDVVDRAAFDAVIAQEVGVPLPRIDTIRLRSDLRQVRGVKDVSIVRDWPTGLTVTVEAREAVLAAPDAQGYALLDVTGTTVGHAADAPADLPVAAVPLEGQTSRVMAAVLTVVAALPTEVSSQVSAIAAPTQDQITLTMRDGSQVVWGGSQSSELKVQVLLTLWAAGVPYSVIDVSAPTAPITR